MHSFLGLVVYASRWIKDLSTLTEPLWKLTHKDMKWEWTTEHHRIFTLIKESLIKTIGYFDTTWDTQVTTDASPVGISAVLTQSNLNNPQDTKIIQFISRTLTATERKYSQIELEALAPVWAVERLNLYTLGRKFKLRIDNKAVALIYNNPLAKPPARIQRWSLRLSSYDFVIEHIPGLGNIADFLSRHPMAALKEDIDETEDYINSIVSYALPKHVSKQKILEATLIDPVLIKLSEAIRTNKIDKNAKDIQSFSRVFNEQINLQYITHSLL